MILGPEIAGQKRSIPWQSATEKPIMVERGCLGLFRSALRSEAWEYRGQKEHIGFAVAILAHQPHHHPLNGAVLEVTVAAIGPRKYAAIFIFY